MTTALAPSTGVADHARGPADAPVTLVEYGNYECLHCRRAYPFVEALRDELGDRLRVVFRHYAPPADFPNAERAAEAAEAAGAQGRFWEMHARLMLGPPALHLSALLAQAADLGLDDRRLRDDLAERVHLARVRDNLAAAIEAGVTSTPSFFVNGVAHATAWDLDSLRAAVLAAHDEAEPRR
jgi:protein-disulfide isomerase